MLLEDKVMFDSESPVKAVANRLFQVYYDHTNDEGNTSLIGLTTMEGIMNSVAYEYRAEVFASFLSLLKMNGVEYNYKVFQSSASKVVH